ncbi:leucine-rich repeat receptor-like serine/threonine/tyrosine-protein kinase SOBIR1 [Carex littledalei]|uniref:Leucine-rich repeat receptor-like serine/threonine/tyrosine-protein kinase SOBIR1 n=1 Tax=Carex littledalei TaxID=544730 RepID=A0A833VT99_9POAL|nr:leucine-rich repeat receptor-like serine/threonine/tyrosine-protein kinase SOBIR1 [Carex littledalei]
MALPSFSILFSILLLFAQLSISDAVHPVRNDRADPYRRHQIGLRRPTRHVVRRPTSARYYSHKKTSSLPNRYILTEKSNNTANSTSNSTSHQTNFNATSNSNSTSHQTNSNATSNSNSTSTNHHHIYKHKVRNWILGFIGGCLGGLFSGMIVSAFFRFLLNCIRGRYRSPSGPSIFMPKVIRAGDLAFLEKEDGLASLEIIGQGGSGKVYKSQLPGNPSKTVAIKQIMKRAGGGGDPTEEETNRLDKWMRQIKSEIKTVGYIRHKNLLPLVAHVSRPDSHFLIYEFMKNGSLLDVLVQAKTGQQELGWPARLRIADGIAAGLEYLHMHHKPQIIHRDLKPANILLDDDMEARIADFGLAKEMPDAHTHMTSSNVAGTLGYIAPEYYQTLKFTAKCDIYSFGVILAVLAMGKQPTDEFFQSTEEMSLVKWLRNTMHADNAAAAIDPVLAGGDFDEQIKLVLRIACFCTVDDPKERPTSKDVKSMISQIGR